MDKQNHFDAVMQALVNHDTEAIKGILKQDTHADFIFLSVPDTRVQLYSPDLLQRVNATVPESLRPRLWKSNYEDKLENILLHLAAKISDFELARLLLEKGADSTSVDPRRRTALHKACKKKSLEMIKFLTEKSPAYILDLGDIYGNTPLDNACRCSTPEVVQFLLSQGSSVTVKTFSRDGPLLNAVLNVAEYATPIASLLLDAGADINHVSPASGTPLIAAVKESLWKTSVKNSAWIKGTTVNSTVCQNYSYIDLLIDRGCDVNAVNSEGQTALHVAVKTKQEILVRKLLISGSDIDIRDVYGFTPIYYACKNRSPRLVDLLIISGADLRAQDWETAFARWKNSEGLNKKSIKLLTYVIHESKQCLTLENMCNITIRKHIRNVEKDAIQLGLPPLLVKRLLLKE